MYLKIILNFNVSNWKSREKIIITKIIQIIKSIMRIN